MTPSRIRSFARGTPHSLLTQLRLVKVLGIKYRDCSAGTTFRDTHSKLRDALAGQGCPFPLSSVFEKRTTRETAVRSPTRYGGLGFARPISGTHTVCTPARLVLEAFPSAGQRRGVAPKCFRRSSTTPRAASGGRYESTSYDERREAPSVPGEIPPGTLKLLYACANKEARLCYSWVKPDGPTVTA